MKKGILLALCLIIPLTLVGCGKPKIDGSSKEAFQSSVKAIEKSLKPEEKKKFAMALAMLMMKKAFEGMGKAMSSKKKMTKQEAEKMMYEGFDGMTYEDVIAEFNKLKTKKKK